MAYGTVVSPESCAAVARPRWPAICKLGSWGQKGEGMGRKGKGEGREEGSQYLFKKIITKNEIKSNYLA